LHARHIILFYDFWHILGDVVTVEIR